MARAKRTARAEGGEVAPDRGVFMISVAAELAGMHPQTLRMYEARGLISPQRSARNTRLYSQADVERLRRIQTLTSEQGLNLAGVEAVLRMEEAVARMRAEMERLREESRQAERRLLDQLEQARRTLGAEMVPYGAYDGLGVEGPEPPARTRITIRRVEEE